MLRYFYIIVCIQVCFCSVYIDNNDYEVLDRRVRCKTTKLHKKTTRSPRKSRLVQFDLQKFMKTADSVVEDTTLYGYRSKKRQDRVTSSNDASFLAPPESTKGRVDNVFNTRSSLDKYQNPRHFNFHSRAFDDKEDVKLSHEDNKATSSFKQNKLGDPSTSIASNRGTKCSFSNMKIPFFSRNKAATKTKRHKHKKRRICSFNCMKKTHPTTTVSCPTDDIMKTVDAKKVNPTITSTDNKAIAAVKVRKIRKRAYEQLCPKCIKELLMNLKKKTTKKVSYSTTSFKAQSKSNTKKRTVKQKADLSDSLREGYLDMANDRLKRNEDEERERRLKELEEVEKKIENVHVAPTYTRNSH